MNELRTAVRRLVVGLGVAAASVLTAPAGAGEPGRVSKSRDPLARVPEVRPADFAKLQAMIKPRPGEAPWAEIPWIADLWEARKKAAAEGKPLFIWSASADPLGCT